MCAQGGTMLKLIFIILLLFLPGNYLHIVSQPAQSKNIQPDDSSDKKSIPSLSYCDLLKSHSRYARKLVRLKAAWRFGFEHSFLYDKQCDQHPRAWIEFVDDKDACPASKKNRTIPVQTDLEADVTVTGKLYGPGHYGHLGFYDYKFVITCLEEIKVTASNNTDK
jgi:hypothetical protein